MCAWMVSVVSCFSPPLVPAYRKSRDKPYLGHPPGHAQDPSVWDLPSGHVGPYRHSKRMWVGVGAQVNQPY